MPVMTAKSAAATVAASTGVANAGIAMRIVRAAPENSSFIFTYFLDQFAES
jgi:hypothetical protein